ncbi:MAG: NusG domain II-containing protein [Lachnospiraceae bacterium]|nr:NusG domain II-containing protein [Lachnospiraceae bacterium]
MFDCGIMSSDKKHFMTKADILLISAILTIALISLLVFRLTRIEGSYANVSYDGMIIMQIPLSQSEDKYYLLTESISLSYDETQPIYDIVELSEEEWLNIQYHSEDYNVLLCQNGEVRMIESSCPDQICVHHSAIYATGESIICLPHKTVIEIINDEGSKLDGVAY